MGSGTEAVKKAIRELGGEKSWAVTTEVEVSAKVGGKKIIYDAPITIKFYFDGHDHSTISIYWEDAGYPNFARLGLYGTSDTRYDRVQTLGE